jgi:hypothetical protein
MGLTNDKLADHDIRNFYGWYALIDIMKRISLLLIVIMHVFLIHAQRFFYVEPGSIAANPLKEDLLKKSQYLAKSQIMSDFTIKTELGPGSRINCASIKIIVEDSATFQPVFETHQEYEFGPLKINARFLLNMAIKTLLARNIDQMILCSKNAHQENMMNWIKLKKDKT